MSDYNYVTVGDILTNERARRELLAMQTNGSFPDLLELTNADFGTLRFVNFFEDVVYNGQTYTAYNFTYNPPNKSSEGIGNASLSISTVDQDLIKKIRTTKKKISARVIGTLVYDNLIDGNFDTLNISKLDELDYKVTTKTWDDYFMDCTLVVDDAMDILMPCDVMNAINCAGCA